MIAAEILSMAKEAGIPFNKHGLIGCDTCECDIDNELERFAEMVAAAEREACARRAKVALLGGSRAISDCVLDAIRKADLNNQFS